MCGILAAHFSDLKTTQATKASGGGGCRTPASHQQPAAASASRRRKTAGERRAAKRRAEGFGFDEVPASRLGCILTGGYAR